MTWNSTVITGSNSVSANKTPLNQNSAYITAKVGLNHFWDGNFIDNGSTVARSGLDGFHSHLELPAFENPSGTSADPTRSANIDGMFYYKKETVRQNDSSTGTEIIPLADNARQGKGAVLIAHAYCEFTFTTAYTSGTVQVPNANIRSHFGIGESGGNLQIVQTNNGKFRITFANAAPTANFIVFGTAFSSSRALYVTSDIATPKTTTTLNILCKDQNGDDVNPSSCMLVVLANG